MSATFSNNVFQTYLSNGKCGPFSLGCREAYGAPVHPTVESDTEDKVL